MVKKWQMPDIATRAGPVRIGDDYRLGRGTVIAPYGREQKPCDLISVDTDERRTCVAD